MRTEFTYTNRNVNIFNEILNITRILLGFTALSATLVITCIGVGHSQNNYMNTIGKKSSNIIFIFTDQQNVKVISAHDNPYLNTPNIDLLVNNGISFINSYCTFHVCGTSRSSLITGKMPHETGLIYNGQSIKEGVQNIGEILSNAGYESVWAGKWRLLESYPQRKQNDSIPGFRLLKFYHPDSSGWELGSKTDKSLANAVLEFIENYTSPKPLFLCVSFHNPHDICYSPLRPEQLENPYLHLLRILLS